jgi:hypothetical protein
MKWIIKPIMRPIARRKLAGLYEDKNRLDAAIQRARKSKSRVSDLYDLAKRVNMECHRWERWLN